MNHDPDKDLGQELAGNLHKRDEFVYIHTRVKAAGGKLPQLNLHIWKSFRQSLS